MKLEYPIKTETGETIEVLEFRRPLASDLLMAVNDTDDPSGYQYLMRLAGNLAIPMRAPDELEGMDADDLAALDVELAAMQAYDPKAITTTENGSRTIALKHPVSMASTRAGVAKTGTIKQITLRRPKAKDVIQMSSAKGGDSEKELGAIVTLSGQDKETILALDAADFHAVQAALDGFFTKIKQARFGN